MVKGLKVDFLEDVTPTSSNTQHRFSPEESEFIAKELKSLMSKGVISLCSHEEGEVISPIFLREKGDGSFRLILNLKKLNTTVEFNHFKMETILSAVKLIRPGAFMCVLDIKDAYYSVPLAREDQKYFKFFHEGKLYKFTALPNGFSPGPRKFTKLLKVPLSHLRKLMILIVAYIDDLLTSAKTFEECFTNVLTIVALLRSLGFVIHPDKSGFIPRQIVEYLGFIINSIKMTLSLSLKRINSIIELGNKLLNSSSVSIRMVARFLGKCTSSFPAVSLGKLHYRALERDKIEALSLNKGNFDKRMSISFEGKDDISWWIDNVADAESPIVIPNPSFVLTSDACKFGWGAVINSLRTGGSFSAAETIENHINVLELKASLFGLQSFCKDIHDTHIKLLMDNTTAVHTVNNMGSCKSVECDNVVQEIWDFALQRKVWLSASYIPGILNVEADEESRKAETRTEWMLCPKTFKRICKSLCIAPDVDLFASRINTQLPLFISFRQDPEAYAVNAFSLDWSSSVFYAFPPFACVDRCLQKIAYDKAFGIIIAPDWPNQPWYPMFLAMSSSSIPIPARRDLLRLPNDPSLEHPIWDRLPLIAALVSGKD